MAVAIAAPAQTFTTFHSFDGIDGKNADGLVQATDGNFYGTTTYGGSHAGWPWGGTVFQITPAGTMTTLYSFCAQTGCSDGTNPEGELIQASDGNFYGTTYGGGADSYGTVFKISPGGALTTLHSFNNTDGANPEGGLIQASDGNFYGTTYGGGADGYGTVFKISPGGALTTVHSFNNTNGAYPEGGLIQASDGNFYGTTTHGGSNQNCPEGSPVGGCGTVFKITLGDTLTTLYSFCAQTGCSDGTYPAAQLVQATDGNFYGTTRYVGAIGDGGTVFKITPGGTLTTIYRFCPYPYCGTDGAQPSTLIQGMDGNFYGTTYYGGAGFTGYVCKRFRCGTIFEVTAAGALATVHSFLNTDGRTPAELIQATDGSFYGTTSGGGANGDGSVFRLAVAPAVTLSRSAWNFGSQALDETSAAKTVTLTNSGSALLTMIGVAISGSGFAISANACGAVLGPGKTCKVSVAFTPTVLGKLSGTLIITDNASNSPQKVLLSGTGVEPATLMPAGAAFGTWVVGTTSTAKTFTLTNNQSVALNNIVITTTRDFAASAMSCTTSLAAKSKCTITVTFTPTAIGMRTGNLSVSDSASNSPQVSNLKGTGK